MIKAFSCIVGAAFAFCSMLAVSAPANNVYEFTSDGYAPTQTLPGVELNGPVSGKLTTRFSEQTGLYTIESMVVNFDKMPGIVATNFNRLNDNEYVAHIKNVWVFRSVKLIAHSPEGFSSPRFVDVRISVDYNESYVGDLGQMLDEGPILVNFGFEPKPRSTFSTIDTYKTTFDGKTVYIKLNKNLSRNSDDQFVSYPNEGIELKVTWYGHGEGSYFFPYPLSANIRPFAIKSDKSTVPESLSVQFRDETVASETPLMPLDFILQESIK